MMSANKMSYEANSCDEKHHSAVPIEQISLVRGPAKSFRVLGGFLIALSLLTIAWHVGLHFTYSTVLAGFLIPCMCGGVLLLVTGIVAVFTGAKKNQRMAVATLVLAIISIMVNFGILGFGAMEIVVSRAMDSKDNESDPLFGSQEITPAMFDDYSTQPTSTEYPDGFAYDVPEWNGPNAYPDYFSLDRMEDTSKPPQLPDNFIFFRRQREAATPSPPSFYYQLLDEETTTPQPWDGENENAISSYYASEVEEEDEGYENDPDDEDEPFWEPPETATTTTTTENVMDWFGYFGTPEASPTTSNWNDEDSWWYQRSTTTRPHPRPRPRPHPSPGPHPSHHHHHHHPHECAFTAHLALSFLTVVTSVICFAVLLAIAICSCRILCTLKNSRVIIYPIHAHTMANNQLGMSEAVCVNCEPGTAAILGEDQPPPSYEYCEKTPLM